MQEPLNASYPVLPLRDIVVFPHMIVPLFVGRDKSVRALEEVMSDDKQILLASQIDPSEDDPSTKGIYHTGVIANVLQLLKLPDGTVKVLVEGQARVKITEYLENPNFFEAKAVRLTEQTGDATALEALVRAVSEEFETLYSDAHLRPRINPQLLREEGRNIIAGTFVPLASLALFHMVTVFPMAWTYLHTPQNITGFLIIEIVGAIIGLGFIVASGFIADRIGRRTLLRNCAIGIAIYAVISPVLLSLGLSGEALYVFIGFALLGLSFGQSSGVVASGFSAKNRYTASNLTSDLAWMFGAGFAPFVALYLTESLGLWSAGAYLLSGALCTLAALTLFRRTQEEEASDAPSRR